MSTSAGDGGFGFELAAGIEAELTLVALSRPEELAALPPAQWLFDPADVQRREIELRNLLGAVHVLWRGLRDETLP